MAGPTDARVALVRNNVLTVIDGRGNAWTYEPSITEDAEGNEIVAPADFAVAEASDNNIMVIDSAGVVWLYALHTGLWSKGPSLDARPPDAVKDPYNPWTKGANVMGPAAPDDTLPAAKSKRSKE